MAYEFYFGLNELQLEKSQVDFASWKSQVGESPLNCNQPKVHEFEIAICSGLGKLTPKYLAIP